MAETLPSSMSAVAPSAMSSDDGYILDDWPQMPDGSKYDGKHLLDLARNGTNPFGNAWNLDLLIQEVETKLHAHVIDIPSVSKGSNNYVRTYYPEDDVYA